MTYEWVTFQVNAYYFYGGLANFITFKTCLI